MTKATPADPKVLIGASIPRSGHHFLVEMVNSYFGKDLRYCEYYTFANCCQQVPCTRRGRYSFIYQKSHDRDFQLPTTVADALYLIQYRHPVPEALSDRELDIKDTLGRPSLGFRRSRAGFTIWLASKAIYYRKFHDKWMANRIPNALYLDYAGLTADPHETMRTIIRGAGAAVDEAHLDDIVERAGGVRAGTGRNAQSFKPRVASDSPYYDAELLGALEDYVLKRCPAYEFPRELNGTYEDSALYAMLLLKDQKEPLPKGETKRLKFVAEIAPEHPEVQRRLAQRMIREGKPAKGIEKLEIVIDRHPFFGPAYQTLLEACAETGTAVPDAVLSGNALLACSESASLLLKLGAAFQDNGYTVNAVAAYSLASALDPDNDEVRERLAAAVKR
jgi:tetratricopeptide (TPR) repeat protein